MKTWKSIPQKYGTANERLLQGAIPVGTVSYNGLRSRNDPLENQWQWRLDLPGRERAGKTETREESMRACEDAFRQWLDKAGLKSTQPS